ncbi:MAG: hypothetical protein GY749_29625 [Desulfobacteraceae bacterium]|nr:hypothetical protein [Desulfobacteraceae bacterium]
MKEQEKILPENMPVLFEELEQECLTAVKYIEALKVRELTQTQKEDIMYCLNSDLIQYFAHMLIFITGMHSHVMAIGINQMKNKGEFLRSFSRVCTDENPKP